MKHDLKSKLLYTIASIQSTKYIYIYTKRKPKSSSYVARDKITIEQLQFMYSYPDGSRWQEVQNI